MLDSSQQKTGCPALQEEGINVNVMSYEHIIMCYVWACRDSGFHSPFVALWRPSLPFVCIFIFFLSLRKTHPSRCVAVTWWHYLRRIDWEPQSLWSHCPAHTGRKSVSPFLSPCYIFFPHMFSVLGFCFVLICLVNLQFSLEITSNPVFRFSLVHLRLD